MSILIIIIDGPKKKKRKNQILDLNPKSSGGPSPRSSPSPNPINSIIQLSLKGKQVFKNGDSGHGAGFNAWIYLDA